MADENIRFVAIAEVVLRADPGEDTEAVNHLLLGDWCELKGPGTAGWCEVRARGDDGWLPEGAISTSRPLEINFVDIGQGDGCHIVTPDDQVILIDAGIGDNMARFLAWRYNLRSRKVAGVEGVAADDPAARAPFEIDIAVISHPDEDHYGGFKFVFQNPKLKIRSIFHNGIVERPIPQDDREPGLTYISSEDIGGFVTTPEGSLLWDVVDTTDQMNAILDRFPTTSKRLLTALRAARTNNDAVTFSALSSADGALPGVTAEDLELKILGPVRLPATFNGEERQCLIRLGNEGVTKNGHSVVFRLTHGRARILLGGDLNTESQAFLLKQHLGLEFDVPDLEKEVRNLRRKGDALDDEERELLRKSQELLAKVAADARGIFGVDVAKACHHGSHKFSNVFLRCLDAIATVISSGDAESHAHPRPDTLGALGKYGRGERPLIFSTELGRSARESSPLSRYLTLIDGFRERLAAATTPQARAAIQKEMDAYRDRHVAVYGMVTLRTDGNQIILAQKLEVPRGNDAKWDIQLLAWNDGVGGFEHVRDNH